MSEITEKFTCKLEDVFTNSTLHNHSLQNALDFIAFLRKNDIVGKGTHGGMTINNVEYLWTECDTANPANDYLITTAWFEFFCDTKPMCFLAIDGNEGDTSWTFWPVGEYNTEYDDIAKYKQTKTIARKNAKICKFCDDKCTAATRKTIFGEVFDNVCIFHMEFINPAGEILECIQNLMLMKKELNHRK